MSRERRLRREAVSPVPSPDCPGSRLRRPHPQDRLSLESRGRPRALGLDAPCGDLSLAEQSPLASGRRRGERRPGLTLSPRPGGDRRLGGPEAGRASSLVVLEELAHGAPGRADREPSSPARARS